MNEYYSNMIRKTTFEELENLPLLTNETFGWSSESVPMIFILCKNEDDETSLDHFVKLQNIVLCDRDGIKVFVNRCKCITVTGNFLLVSVSGSCFFFHQLTHTGACCDNAFNSV